MCRDSYKRNASVSELKFVVNYKVITESVTKTTLKYTVDGCSYTPISTVNNVSRNVLNNVFILSGESYLLIIFFPFSIFYKYFTILTSYFQFDVI